MNIEVIVPLVVFLLFTFAIGIWSARKRTGAASFLHDYYLGSRELGGLVLAMTMVATYGSASSFVGGPGIAYDRGLGWVLLSMAQVVTGYFTLMILGKRFAVMARRYRAVTLVDFLRSRYNNGLVVILGAFSIVIFLFSAMAAQWVGGARLIESVTGMSYQASLFLFAAAVLFYVIIGGFRAVVVTDAVQGIIMVVGTLIIFTATLIAGGGMNNIMTSLYQENPNLVTPFGADGDLTALYVSSFWILVGVGVVGLPQVAVRAMSYKSSAAMHRALLIGTAVVAFMMFGMHMAGVMGRVVVPGIEVADTVMPELTMTVLPGWLAGIVLAAPMAAIMSTVDSLLLMISSSVVKDVYINYIKPDASENRIRLLSLIVTAAVGIIVVAISWSPPEFLIWLNLFAFGGLEAAFIWPIVLGLYWKKANGWGALAAMVTGIASYMIISIWLPGWLGMHEVAMPVLFSLAAFVLVSLLTNRQQNEWAPLENN
ncbi:sodium/pantothenate symporter [Marinococcus halotolerans]|uniref:sodium/pantothenate symporter n=1 Tax=Marinococcus halotolerans TaxID=301092 RepID=UPI0003B70097|nr:sodium/pantothenate symporter [Marinococcus halotolerans]